MARVAGPHTRLVMAGGWSEGVAARAIKEAHCGPFERFARGLHGRPRRRAHSRARGGSFAERQVGPHEVSPSPAMPQCSDSAVHQVETEPPVSGSGLAPLRLARAARVLDLEVEDAVALRRADADDVGRVPARRAGRCWPTSSVATSSASPELALGHAPGEPAAQDRATSSADSARAKTFMCSGLTTASPSWTAPMSATPCDPFLSGFVIPAMSRRVTGLGQGQDTPALPPAIHSAPESTSFARR
jgi:hypothetical protein